MILAKMTQLVGYKVNNNNTVCYVIILSLLTAVLELGICPLGLADVWHTTKYLLFRSFFLFTTNFTFPQAPFYNMNSLTDTFRCSQKWKIKLNSCGLSVPAAEQILIRQPLPARITNTPVWFRPAGTNMASSYHSSAWLPTTPFQHAQNRRVKMQISMQMLLKLW